MSEFTPAQLGSCWVLHNTQNAVACQTALAGLVSEQLFAVLPAWGVLGTELQPHDAAVGTCTLGAMPPGNLHQRLGEVSKDETAGSFAN